MAKDDYDVLVYKILLYLYARMKGKIAFDQAVYDKAIGKEKLSDGYLERVYKLMTDEGLIEGYKYTKPWGQSYVSLSEDIDLEITAKGIHYVQENGNMRKVKRFLIEKVDFLAELIGITGI